MKSKGLWSFVSLGVALCAALIITGCNSPFPTAQTIGVKVDPAKGDYKVVARGISGSSQGTRVLFMTSAPSYEEAVKEVYRNAAIRPGDNYALVNCTETKSIKDYFFWEFPKITITADIIEYNKK